MRRIFIILSAFLFSQQSIASHLMGGEITWKCQANGQYIFKMILYRDCSGNGPSMPTMISLEVYGNPSLTYIPMNDSTISDISYCQNYPENNCNSANPLLGTIQEGLFFSNPITLNGVPPATGWTFVWHSCCRNGAITNVTPNGFSLRATMFPYNGQNADPCFDSSPSFAEKPKSVLCSGSPFVYNHGAFDDDMDSLHFEWGIPLEEPTNLPPAAWNPDDTLGANPYYATFNAPYDFQHPLPYLSPNTGATIDLLNGEINFTSFTAGNFVTNVKVSSFKCGIKVSEVFREIQFCILGNCLPNNNPTTQAPFQDTSGVFTEWIDTVTAGDFVSFNLWTSDFDIDTAGNPQSVTLSAYGSQFGANFSDTASGCLVPPCAVITTPMPSTSPIATSITFNWQTTVDHLGMFYPCAYIPNTYYFNFKATDSSCPAPAVDYKTVAITVLPVYPRPTINNNNSILTCVETGFDYQWYMNRMPISGATGKVYIPVQPGMFQVRITDSIGSGNYSEGMNVSVLNAISPVSGLQSFSIYPNPATDLLEMEYTETVSRNVTVSLYDMTGRMVIQKEVPGSLGNNKLAFSVQDFPAGVYTFEIRNSMEMLRKKVVIAKN